MGRKRAREITWEDILSNSDSHGRFPNLTPEQFLQLHEEERDAILSWFNLSEQKQYIFLRLEEIMSTGQCLPSPSKMTWKDASSVLENYPSLPKPIDLPCIPTEEGQANRALKEVQKIISYNFRNVTEMEVVVRVATIVAFAVKDLEVKVQLEPSVDDRPGATDFLILVKDSKEKTPLCFIEAKRSTYFPDLSGESDVTAQILREAQILLNHYKVQLLPCIVTNGKFWSIGVAERVDNSKIKLISICNLLDSEWTTIITYITALVQKREWPPRQSPSAS